MGCFLGCFGSSKDKDEKKRPKNPQIASYRNQEFRNQYKSLHPTLTPTPTSISTVPANQDTVKKHVDFLVPESLLKQEVKVEKEHSSLPQKDKSEEQIQLSSSTRKKVTFDTNIKEYEHKSFDEPPVVIQESEKGGGKEFVESSIEPIKSLSVSEDSTVSSLGSFPPNHRYQNCRESDDEDEELDCGVCDLDEDEDEEEDGYDDEFSDDECHPIQVQEHLARFCASVESRTKSSATCLVADGDDEHMLDQGSSERGTITPIVFNRSARDRAGYVHSVLNPVENTAQWKTVKVKGTPPVIEQKENLQTDLGFQQFPLKSKSKSDETKSNDEVVIAASLSSWLVSSQSTPPSKATIGLEPLSSGASLSSHGSNFVRSHDERPILGALTVEELKQFSATSSPRKSPSRSPNERPLLGTVGVHWNDRTPVDDSGSVSSFKGIPNTTSKYREDKTVNWHSTPFETRLERALNRDAAEYHASHRVC